MVGNSASRNRPASGSRCARARGDNLFARLQYPPGARDDLLARFRQRHVLGLALDELHPQIVFQFLQLRGQGGLADKAFLGGPPEMARVGHRNQVTQILQLDIDALAHGNPIYRIYRSYHINRLEL